MILIPDLILTGWRVGADKIGAEKALRNAGLSVKEAHTAITACIDGKIVAITISPNADRIALRDTLTEAGINHGWQR